MYEVNVSLSPKDILNKDFKVDAKGYRPQEVDKFLDMIIRDYTEFMNIIKKLEKENHSLEEENSKLRSKYRKLKDNIESASEGNCGTSNNLDLLRRLSNLEKVVYGKDN